MTPAAACTSSNSSTSTLMKRAPVCLPLSSPKKGAILWHGPHLRNARPRAGAHVKVARVARRGEVARSDAPDSREVDDDRHLPRQLHRGLPLLDRVNAHHLAQLRLERLDVVARRTATIHAVLCSRRQLGLGRLHLPADAIPQVLLHGVAQRLDGRDERVGPSNERLLSARRQPADQGARRGSVGRCPARGHGRRWRGPAHRSQTGLPRYRMMGSSAVTGMQTGPMQMSGMCEQLSE